MGRAAVRAGASRRQPIIVDEVAIALDEQRLAVVAARVLEIADPARQVAGVDVAQAVARVPISAAAISISGVVFSGSVIR